jgi:hypothetical protein
MRPITPARLHPKRKPSTGAHTPPEFDPRPSYEPPHLQVLGPLGELICGSSWKGVDSNGQIDPENFYPS